MVLSVSGNESYASVKAEGRFLLEESECWSLMAHMGLSSRKRCLFLEGESKILLEYRLLPFRKGVWTSRGWYRRYKEDTQGTQHC